MITTTWRRVGDLFISRCPIYATVQRSVRFCTHGFWPPLFYPSCWSLDVQIFSTRGVALVFSSTNTTTNASANPSTKRIHVLKSWQPFNPKIPRSRMKEIDTFRGSVESGSCAVNEEQRNVQPMMKSSGDSIQSGCIWLLCWQEENGCASCVLAPFLHPWYVQLCHCLWVDLQMLSMFSDLNYRAIYPKPRHRACLSTIPAAKCLHQ
jgi:hypothetical protein